MASKNYYHITITDLVLAFCDNKEYETPDNLSEEVSEAVKAQLELGLDSFLCGFLAAKWRIAQKVHLTEISSRRCEKK